MTINFRALCADLLRELENAIAVHYGEGGTHHISAADAVIARADAALAQPVPDVAGPTDEELDAWITECADATRYGPLEHYWAFDVQFDHVRDIARAVLARHGRPAPAPAEGEVAEENDHSADASKMVGPALAPAGEVAELTAALRNEATNCTCTLLTSGDLRRIADLLERQAAPVPVAVSERLPEPSVKVLAHYFNDLGKGRTICAIWVPAETRSDRYGDDDFTEYDEESDTFYWPEGWYEAIENWDDLGYVKVYEGEVIYWQPLPKWPAHALPLPSGEVEHG